MLAESFGSGDTAAPREARAVRAIERDLGLIIVIIVGNKYVSWL